MGSNGGVRTKPAILGIYSRESRPIARVAYIFVHKTLLDTPIENEKSEHVTRRAIPIASFLVQVERLL